MKALRKKNTTDVWGKVFSHPDYLYDDYIEICQVPDLFHDSMAMSHITKYMSDEAEEWELVQVELTVL